MSESAPILSHNLPDAEFVRRLMQHETLLPESAHNTMEVVGVLKAYAHVIGAYYENLLYVADTQFLVLFPFFKYMNGNRSFAHLLKHWRHDRINYEFSEYCMKAMFWLQGAIEFFDDQGVFTETVDVFWFINHYVSYCREKCLPINQTLFV